MYIYMLHSKIRGRFGGQKMSPKLSATIWATRKKWNNLFPKENNENSEYHH